MTLRRAAEQALAAIKSANQVNYSWACVEAVAALETALAEDALQRLTDVQQEIKAALAEQNKCTHGVTDGNCKECYMAEPEQEPVAWAIYYKGGGSKSLHWPEQHSPNGDANMFDAIALYTAPPQRLPLTDEEIEQAYRHIYHNVPDGSYRTTYYWIEQGIRYAEQAHGIKEEA